MQTVLQLLIQKKKLNALNAVCSPQTGGQTDRQTDGQVQVEPCRDATAC